MAAVDAFWNQVIQYSGMAGYKTYFMGDVVWSTGVAGTENVYHVPCRTYLDIYVKFFKKERVACVVGWESKTEGVPAMNPDYRGILAVAERAYMNISAHWFSGEELAYNGYYQAKGQYS